MPAAQGSYALVRIATAAPRTHLPVHASRLALGLTWVMACRCGVHCKCRGPTACVFHSPPPLTEYNITSVPESAAQGLPTVPIPPPAPGNDASTQFSVPGLPSGARYTLSVWAVSQGGHPPCMFV